LRECAVAASVGATSGARATRRFPFPYPVLCSRPCTSGPAGRSRERVIGALCLATREPRTLAAHDLALARELAWRAALAADAARLFERARRATAARDAVLGIVSHDLRSAVGTVSMCIHALLDRPHSDGERAAVHATIAEATRWMNRLVEDLFDVASIETGRLSIEPERESIAPIVVAAVDMFAARAAARSIDLRTEVSDDAPIVRADGERIVQVLANLIDNALKYTPAGGTITVRAEPLTSSTAASAACRRRGTRRRRARSPCDRTPRSSPPASHRGGRPASGRRR
jgi:signal transduction histidine kinase